MPQTQEIKLYAVIAAVIVIGAVLTAALVFLARNTSFLNLPVPPEAITGNNNDFAPPSGSPAEFDLTGSRSQTLIVPSQWRQGTLNQERQLTLPPAFTISVFASGLGSARFMTFDAAGNLLITDRDGGKVYMLPDTDRNGIADRKITVDSGLRNPHGIDFYNGDLFVGEEHQIVVYRSLNAEGKFSSKEVLIPNLPAGAGHVTRTVKVGPDGKLYVSIGSSCNVCDEADERRASIMRFNLDGTGGQIFARGLRNSVGFVFRQSASGHEIWATDNGRDLIGDDSPLEEINIILEGRHYGWPFCHSDGLQNPEYTSYADFCRNETVIPEYGMQAHSAPLGLNFFPSGTPLSTPESVGQLFVAFHGSWNRSVPTGYKIVRIDTSADKRSQPTDFITGWLQPDGTAWGRPVDIVFDRSGNGYISDDRAGAVYLVRYTGQP